MTSLLPDHATGGLAWMSVLEQIAKAWGPGMRSSEAYPGSLYLESWTGTKGNSHSIMDSLNVWQWLVIFYANINVSKDTLETSNHG